MRTLWLLIGLTLTSPVFGGPLSRAAELAEEWAASGVPAASVQDGWYAIEFLTCIDCPTAKAEYAALQKAGWEITLVDASHPVVQLVKPETLPAVVQIRNGSAAGVVTWPFDRWDVGALVGRARPQPQIVEPKPVQQSQALMYLPSGSSVWVESGGGTSFQHLVGHGYNPAILRNTPPQYYGMLHGDAHEGRRSRVVPVPQRSVSYQRVGYAGCPTGSG